MWRAARFSVRCSAWLPCPGGPWRSSGRAFCGTLTTFSTFGADVLRLLEEHGLGRAMAYLAASLVLGLGAVAAGYAGTQGLWSDAMR